MVKRTQTIRRQFAAGSMFDHFVVPKKAKI